MATINSFELAEFGDWLRYRFEISLSGGETLTGYDAWYSDTTSTPDWGDSVDCGTVGQNPSDANSFEVFVYTPSGAITAGETFEEYEVGTPTTLDLGGNIWGGAWTLIQPEYANDSFEEYTVGTPTVLDGGEGFNGAWSFIDG